MCVRVCVCVCVCVCFVFVAYRAYIGGTSAPQGSMCVCMCVCVSIQWPDESLVPGYRLTMETYLHTCIELGRR